MGLTRKKLKQIAATKRKGDDLFNLRLSTTDRKRIRQAAKKYAKGNMSAWLRFAAVSFKPKAAPKIPAYKAG